LALPSPCVSGVLGSLVAGLATGVGALPIFVRNQWSVPAQRMMLAAAGGMMLGASFFSLVQPALDHVTSRGGGPLRAVATVAIGLVLGAVTLWAIHGALPHEHLGKGREGGDGRDLPRHTLVVLAIALHNIPEGLSVGVAFGDGGASGATGPAVMLGIGAQNMPEGLAVAAALVADGSTRGLAFLIATLTGLVEPLGGLLDALAVGLSAALLPWALAFAAGAMLFVVSGEVIPETHTGGRERAATFAVIGGFVLMMTVAVLLG
jgi:ZIP family zinc transporter